MQTGRGKALDLEESVQALARTVGVSAGFHRDFLSRTFEGSLIRSLTFCSLARRCVQCPGAAFFP